MWVLAAADSNILFHLERRDWLGEQKLSILRIPADGDVIQRLSVGPALVKVTVHDELVSAGVEITGERDVAAAARLVSESAT